MIARIASAQRPEEATAGSGSVKGETRIALNNILLSTDFSRSADAAVPYAIEIARLYGSKVYMTHVRAGPSDWNEANEKEVEKLHDRFRDIPHEILVEEGDVLPTLLNLLAEKKIDLVVTGTHGRTGLGRVLVGSVAEAIFREAPCPVLTVGPRLLADPKWSLKIKEILYATDLDMKTPAAAAHAISLAQENQVRLTLPTWCRSQRQAWSIPSGLSPQSCASSRRWFRRKPNSGASHTAWWNMEIRLKRFSMSPEDTMLT